MNDREPTRMTDFPPLDVLAIMAHPDDAELLAGGALIRSVDRGQRVGVVDLTAGERGSFGSKETRREEAARAARVMGLATRRSAGLSDSALQNDEAARGTVVALLRELRPRIVVTHAIHGRHPDHRVAAELVYDSAFLSGLGNFEAPGEPHRPLKVVHATTFREDPGKPTFVIDITEQMDRKLEALACFASQFDGRSAAGEVFPGGSRPLMEQVRARCAHYGSLIRVPYGECYWTRETLSVDGFGSLGVSSF